MQGFFRKLTKLVVWLRPLFLETVWGVLGSFRFMKIVERHRMNGNIPVKANIECFSYIWSK